MRNSKGIFRLYWRSLFRGHETAMSLVHTMLCSKHLVRWRSFFPMYEILSRFSTLPNHSPLLLRNGHILGAIQPSICTTNRISSQHLYPQMRDGELDSEFLVDTLVEWLDCSAEQASSILKECPKLKSCHLISVKDCIRYLKDNNIDSKLVVDNPWLLNYSFSTIRQRMDALAPIKITPTTIPLLKLTPKQLNKIAKRWTADTQNQNCIGFENRLEFLAYHLQCDARDLTFEMDRHIHLLTTDFNKLSSILHMLLQNGVKPTEILNNLAVFQFRVEHLECRLKAIREANIANVKIWMLQCPKQLFIDSVEKFQDTKHDLEEKDVVTYLAERLECSQEYVLCLTKRFPPLLNIRLTKVKVVLDFLLTNGFTPNQICLAPHVFRNRVATLKSRLDDFKSLGYKPVHLHSLCASTKDHKRFFNQLQQERNSSNSNSSTTE